MDRFIFEIKTLWSRVVIVTCLFLLVFRRSEGHGIKIILPCVKRVSVTTSAGEHLGHACSRQLRLLGFFWSVRVARACLEELTIRKLRLTWRRCATRIQDQGRDRHVLLHTRNRGWRPACACLTRGYGAPHLKPLPTRDAGSGAFTSCKRTMLWVRSMSINSQCITMIQSQVHSDLTRL